jgi:hypothetical protein
LTFRAVYRNGTVRVIVRSVSSTLAEALGRRFISEKSTAAL